MLKFIKAYWLFVLLFLFGAAITAFNAINGDLGNTIFGVAFCVLTSYSVLNKMDYDELYEQHADLVLEYIKELNSNLEFIKGTRARLSDVFNDVSLNDFQGVVNPVTGELDTILVDVKPTKKRGRPKKAVQPTKAKRSKLKKNA